MTFLQKILLPLLCLLLVPVFFFLVGRAPRPEKIKWGVNFSSKQARLLGLDPRDTYLALLRELGAKRIKLITHWDEVEGKREEYDFSSLDWQIKKANSHGARVLLVVGMKTGRWPECHPPSWAKNLSPKKREEAVRRLVENTIGRYKENPAVWGFQIENEPFLAFGECPFRPKGFLKREVSLAHKLTDKPIVISDSGEWSFWSRPARLGDVVATTIYRTAWFKRFRIYATYPLPPVFYRRKALIVKWFFNKEVICGELQAEPWGPVLLSDLPRSEQKKTMNPEKFTKVIDYAQRTGLDNFYLWGAEWWYWLKTKRNEPAMWERANKLFP